MLRYRTVRQEAKAEIMIEKSRFIAHIRPVASKEEANVFFAEIRAGHCNATHNVPAFVIGEKMEHQWASDDGEPQGTSGAPMLQMLVKEGVTNVAVIVTRYFGGIKLGTGGLVRAYTGAAKLALTEAGICEVHELAILSFSVDYTFLGKLQNLAQNGDFEIVDTVFEDCVILSVATASEEADRVRSAVANVTGGHAAEGSETRRLVKKTEIAAICR